MGEATTRRNAGRRGDVRPVVLAERRRAWPFWCYTMVFSSPPPLFFSPFSVSIQCAVVRSMASCRYLHCLFSLRVLLDGCRHWALFICTPLPLGEGCSLSARDQSRDLVLVHALPAYYLYVGWL